MGTKKNVDMSISPEDLEKLEKAKKEAEKAEAQAKAAEAAQDNENEEESAEGPAIKQPQAKPRSSNYRKAKAYVDRTKYYELEKAIETVKKASYSNFEGTITAHATVKDDKLNLETDFPHSYGKETHVAIWSPETEKKVEEGNIDFDILLAKPDQMSGIAKYARVLGPQGLMPNPKSNTVVENPEERKEELESGHTQQIKTERKAPLIHVTVGKTGQDKKELVENIEHLIKAIGPKKVVKMTIAATMSPGVKVDLDPYQAA